MTTLSTRAACLLALLLAAGCGGREAARAPAAPPVEDSVAVFTRARQNEARVRTLRAQFEARVVRAGEVREASGVLLVKKPDRFRLRLLSPLGITVFDYTSVGSHRRMQLPTEGKQFDDAAIDTNAPFSPNALRAVFLRGDSAFPAGCASTTDAATVLVRCPTAPGQPFFVIAPATADISFEGRGPIGVSYFDYRPVAGARLPYAVVVNDRDSGTDLSITVRRYEVNPDLADGLFADQEPAR